MLVLGGRLQDVESRQARQRWKTVVLCVDQHQNFIREGLGPLVLNIHVGGQIDSKIPPFIIILSLQSLYHKVCL